MKKKKEEKQEKGETGEKKKNGEMKIGRRGKTEEKG